jgi:hypothetical protein
MAANCRAAEAPLAAAVQADAQQEDRRRSFAHAGPSFGTAYVYDAELLMHRLGPELAVKMPSVRRLLRSLRQGGSLLPLQSWNCRFCIVGVILPEGPALGWDSTYAHSRNVALGR